MTGAGTYHPATSTPSFVEPDGMGITNTINRAELAAITAAILHGQSHIAADSLSSLHQIRKHLLNSELHRHHEQGDILKILMQIIRNSPNPVHLFKVKSHAGIAGNKCTDAVAKYQATQVDANLADTGMSCAGINGNPFHNITSARLAYIRKGYPLRFNILKALQPTCPVATWLSNGAAHTV